VPVTDAVFLHMHPNLSNEHTGECLLNKQRDKLHSKLFLVALKEGENDMIALIVSFIFVNSLRFSVGGHLPNSLGEEESAELLDHTWTQIGFLYFGSLFCLFTLILYRQSKGTCKPPSPGRRSIRIEGRNQKEEDIDICSSSESDEEEVVYEPKPWKVRGRIKSHLGDFQRLGTVMQNILLMSFAWSFYFATQWLVVRSGSSSKHLVKSHSTVDGTLLDLIVAMVVSVFGGLGIWGLDGLADNIHEITHDPEDEASIRAIIRAIALLVGFAWEQAFDVVVVSVGGAIMYGGLGKLFVIAFIVSIIAPAWINHIIPMREEHGYRFGFVPRKVALQAEYAFSQKQEYGTDLVRANEYSIMLMTLARALPRDLMPKLEEANATITSHSEFFNVLKSASGHGIRSNTIQQDEEIQSI